MAASLSSIDLQDQLWRQTRELEEARDERAALAEVLRVISSSAGNLKPVFQTILESFPLAPHIEDVVKTIEPLAAKNGNRIVVDRAADVGTIHADQTRFRQALLNLMSNANKFTENGTVTIAARHERTDGCESRLR